MSLIMLHIAYKSFQSSHEEKKETCSYKLYNTDQSEAKRS